MVCGGRGAGSSRHCRANSRSVMTGRGRRAFGGVGTMRPRPLVMPLPDQAPPPPGPRPFLVAGPSPTQVGWSPKPPAHYAPRGVSGPRFCCVLVLSPGSGVGPDPQFAHLQGEEAMLAGSVSLGACLSVGRFRAGPRDSLCLWSRVGLS